MKSMLQQCLEVLASLAGSIKIGDTTVKGLAMTDTVVKFENGKRTIVPLGNPIPTAKVSSAKRVRTILTSDLGLVDENKDPRLQEAKKQMAAGKLDRAGYDAIVPPEKRLHTVLNKDADCPFGEVEVRTGGQRRRLLVLKADVPAAKAAARALVPQTPNPLL